MRSNCTESQVIDRVKQGGSLREMAKDLGCSRETIKRVMAKHQLKLIKPNTDDVTSAHKKIYVRESHLKALSEWGLKRGIKSVHEAGRVFIDEALKAGI